jgi:hypothetical protein
MSVGALADEGHIIVFSGSQCLILNNAIEKRVFLTSYRNCSNGLYTFTNKGAKQMVNHIVSNSHQLGNYNHCNIVIDQNTWHARLNHLHYGGLQHLPTGNRVIGLPNISFKHVVCESCLAGKQYREPLTHTSENRATRPYSFKSHRTNQDYLPWKISIFFSSHK